MSSARRYRLVRGGLLSAAVGVLACVVVAAPVFAFVSRRTHVVVVPAPPNRRMFGSSTATCPTGQHVLFGGFENATGMRRTADNRWTVEGWNQGIIGPPMLGESPAPPLSLSSYAYCGYGPVPSKATSTLDLHYGSGRGGDGYGSATARCPEGTVVVAGGFATTPLSAVTVTDLERVAADLWRVSAYLTTSTHSALTSIAYCGPGPAPKLVSQSTAAFNHAGDLGTVRATCPAGRNLVFGGATMQRTGDESLQTMRVPAKTKNTWAVTGNAGGVFGELTALAYCR